MIALSIVLIMIGVVFIVIGFIADTSYLSLFIGTMFIAGALVTMYDEGYKQGQTDVLLGKVKYKVIELK